MMYGYYSYIADLMSCYYRYYSLLYAINQIDFFSVIKMKDL